MTLRMMKVVVLVGVLFLSGCAFLVGIKQENTLDQVHQGDSYWPFDPGRNWGFTGSASLIPFTMAWESGGQSHMDGYDVTIISAKGGTPVSSVHSTMFFVEDGDDIKLYRQDNVVGVDVGVMEGTGNLSFIFMPPKTLLKRTQMKKGDKWVNKGKKVEIKDLSDLNFMKYHPANKLVDMEALLNNNPALKGRTETPYEEENEVMGEEEVVTKFGTFKAIHIRQELSGGNQEQHTWYAMGYGPIKQETWVVPKNKVLTTASLIDMDSRSVRIYLGVWDAAEKMKWISDKVKGMAKDKLKSVVGQPTMEN